jgi:DNA polymerase-3 subunit gamma/tau
MENFVVSARKYRPQHFSTVVGQSHITTTLKNAILQHHLAHAFLFCGPRGVGKTTCARILAKTINCEQLGKDGEACDNCNSCQSFNNGASFNIHELDAASNNSVDDIRELIEQVRFAPQAGKYKIYIIDEVHMLSSNAFNAFLKTLEEPPAHAIFILATTEKHKILPTILSRCQIFDFKRITPADIAAHLEEITTKENIKAEPTALHVIAQKSDGCMRDALSILDKIVSFTSANLTYSNTLEHLNLLDEDYFFKLLDLLDSEDLPGVLTIYDEIDKKGFDGDMVLNNLSEFFRNLLVSRDPRSISLLQVVEGFRNRYIAAAASISPAYMIGALNILNDAELGFKQARNKKLHVEFHLIKLTHLKQAVNLVEDGNAVKKKRVDEIKPVAFKQITFAPQKSKSSAKLVIETPLQTVHPKQMQPNASVLPHPIEMPLAKPASVIPPSQAPADPVTGGFGSLKKIREQIQNRKHEQAEVFTLNEERLGTAWTAYLQKLQENNQVTSLSNLKMAKVTIIDELVFEITADTRIQQQFIESEKVGLLIHVQDFFNNPKVQFSVQLNPSADVEEVVKDQPLSLREQYFKMIERYPIIKDMRDQLNLDLDY